MDTKEPISRRALLKRAGVVGAVGAAGAALPIGSQAGAVNDGLNTALGGITEVVVTKFGAANEIQQALNALGAGGGALRVIAADNQLPYVWRQKVDLSSNQHLVFEPGFRFIIDAWTDTRSNGLPGFAFAIAENASNVSITGGSWDLNNQLVVVGGDDVNAGAGVLMTGVTDVTLDGVEFLNTGGAVGRTDFIGSPPSGIQVRQSAKVTITGCHFSQVHIAINATDADDLIIDNNTFDDLLDDFPSHLFDGGGEIPVDGDGKVNAEGYTGDRVDGGAFVLLGNTCERVTIENNATTPATDGQPAGYAYGAAEVGGSIILTQPGALTVLPGQPVFSGSGANLQRIDGSAHRDLFVRNNRFLSRVGASIDNGNNGASGDIITVKNVIGFEVSHNLVDNAGEFGIVVSHGSLNGDVVDNHLLGVDGSAIVVGAQNVRSEPPDGGALVQGNPQVGNVRVRRNLVVNVGLDGDGTLARYRATPANTTIANYPNAVSGLRIWNAQTVVVGDNAILQYRSSGIWVKYGFSSAEDKADNESIDITIEDTNALEPYRAGDPFTMQGQHPDKSDEQPWTGPSLVPEIDPITGEASARADRAFVRGFDATRYVGPAASAPSHDWIGAPVGQEVVIVYNCLGGFGRVDTYVFNSGCDAAVFEVDVAERLSNGLLGPAVDKPAITLAAGEESLISVTGRRPYFQNSTELRTYNIKVIKDGVVQIDEDHQFTECPVP